MRVQVQVQVRVRVRARAWSNPVNTLVVVKARAQLEGRGPGVHETREGKGCARAIRV